MSAFARARTAPGPADRVTSCRRRSTTGQTSSREAASRVPYNGFPAPFIRQAAPPFREPAARHYRAGSPTRCRTRSRRVSSQGNRCAARMGSQVPASLAQDRGRAGESQSPLSLVATRHGVYGGTLRARANERHKERLALRRYGCAHLIPPNASHRPSRRGVDDGLLQQQCAHYLRRLRLPRTALQDRPAALRRVAARDPAAVEARGPRGPTAPPLGRAAVRGPAMRAPARPTRTAARVIFAAFLNPPDAPRPAPAFKRRPEGPCGPFAPCG